MELKEILTAQAFFFVLNKSHLIVKITARNLVSQRTFLDEILTDPTDPKFS